MCINKRNTLSIGKEHFNFDFRLEKKIYSYLYGLIPRKYKKLKKKYDNYSEWKEYVQNKHKDKSSSKLVDFNRYLQQIYEDEKSTCKFWNICVPIFMSLIITNIPKMVKDIVETDFSKLSILNGVLCDYSYETIVGGFYLKK